MCTPDSIRTRLDPRNPYPVHIRRLLVVASRQNPAKATPAGKAWAHLPVGHPSARRACCSAKRTAACRTGCLTGTTTMLIVVSATVTAMLTIMLTVTERCEGLLREHGTESVGRHFCCPGGRRLTRVTRIRSAGARVLARLSGRPGACRRLGLPGPRRELRATRAAEAAEAEEHAEVRVRPVQRRQVVRQALATAPIPTRAGANEPSRRVRQSVSRPVTRSGSSVRSSQDRPVMQSRFRPPQSRATARTPHYARHRSCITLHKMLPAAF